MVHPVGLGFRRLRRGAFPLNCVTALALPAAASRQPAEAPFWAQPKPPAELPHLLLLPGEAAWVLYTLGSLDRASHVQEWLRTLAIDHGRWSGSPVPLSALVLSREEWEGAGMPRPYGLPLGLGGGVVVLPSAGDTGTVAGWRALLGGSLPAVEGNPLWGTAGEAGSLLASQGWSPWCRPRATSSDGIPIFTPWARAAGGTARAAGYPSPSWTQRQRSDCSATGCWRCSLRRAS